MSEMRSKEDVRRVVIASLLGSTIEWYDFFLYGAVAGIVFNKLFFPTTDPIVSILLAYTTFAIGFVARPLGGLVFGHFGDKVGRKSVLVATLMIMGVATVLIGCLPTYEQIGIAAPILLVVLRLAQGIGLGGEWGGAVLMAYEYAPENKRGLYASIPQIGLAIGLCMASGVVALLSRLHDADFLAWGWRVAFIASIILVVIGLYVRVKIIETPDFQRVKEQNAEVKLPALAMLKEYPGNILLGMGARYIDGVFFNVFAVFSIAYLTQLAPIKIPRETALWAVSASALVMIATIPFFGWVSDKIGRPKTYAIGSLLLALSAYPAFALMSTGDQVTIFLALIIPFGIIYAMCYGPEAGLFADLFDARVRYSGISFVYQFSGIFASGLTPIIATYLIEANGKQPWYLVGYVVFAALVSMVSALMIQKRAAHANPPLGRTMAPRDPALGDCRMSIAWRNQMKMTTEEAFVKVLQMHGIEHAFGIIGSAMMPISDLFPKAGITFWDCAHETNAGMICDGFTRSTGKMGMAIAQNGPGVTGFVTAIKTAYWNHTPMLLVTPQAANKTIGQGGFQEVEQMAMFKDMVCYQEELRDPSRVAEVLNRVISKAKRLSAPAQMNVPRDYWTQVVDITLPDIIEFERPTGGTQAIAEAAKLLSSAKFPVILSGAGVVIGNAIPACIALAERLDAPVCSNYQHNDSFPGSHRLACGPLGYNGSQAAMELIAEADVVLALGTRLNPFSTLPGYGLDYWPKNAKTIQVDINPDRIGLTKPVAVGICGDAKAVAEQILTQLGPSAGDGGREERKALIHQTKSTWLQKLASMDHEDDDPGTTWNERARARDPERMSPRMAWRAIQAGLPHEAIISSDIGNNCAIGNAYPTFEQGRKYLAPGLFGPCGYGFPSIIGAKIGNPNTPVVGFAGDGAFGISMSEMSSIGREEWPAITMVIFRNYQWGAEKRNTTLWFEDNFVGTELDPHLSYAKVAEGCGLKGVTVRSMQQLTGELEKACDAQKDGVTTFIEVILNQELGEPFRRDAMKKPVTVAGIDPRDMRPQKGHDAAVASGS